MTDTSTDLFLDLPNLRLHLVDWGGLDDIPAILLIHGLASNAKMWNLVAPTLARSYRVMAVDQRSHGLTAVPDDYNYSFAAVCDDIHLVCEHFEIERPIVVGHSWGANVALEYAARYADSVTGIVAIDGGFIGLNKVMTWPQIKEVAAPPRWSGTPFTEYLERAKQSWGEHLSAEALDEIMGNIEVYDNQTIAPRLAFDDHLEILRATWEQDADTLYAQVKSPALFLPCLPPEPHNSQTQRFLAWERKTATRIQTLMPNAQIDWLVDSIHNVPLQRPKLITEKIRAFVGNVQLSSV